MSLSFLKGFGVNNVILDFHTALGKVCLGNFSELLNACIVAENRGMHSQVNGNAAKELGLVIAAGAVENSGGAYLVSALSGRRGVRNRIGPFASVGESLPRLETTRSINDE